MEQHIAEHTNPIDSSLRHSVVAAASVADAERTPDCIETPVSPGGADSDGGSPGRATPRRLPRPGAATLAYDDLGSGDRALLFTPGWCVSRRVFNSLPQQCAANSRVLCLDWRGHGESGVGTTDFGDQDLVEDAVDVIRASGAKRVVPVALAHSGWIAIELRRRLGAQIEKIILVDWLVAEAPPAFIAALHGLRNVNTWQSTRDGLFDMWLRGVDCAPLQAFIPADMGRYDFSMWARAAREISNAYAHNGSPLRALSALAPTVQVLHIYAQPDDPSYLSLQQGFAREHPWYQVHKLNAGSHFPMFEVPSEMAEIMRRFSI